MGSEHSSPGLCPLELLPRTPLVAAPPKQVKGHVVETKKLSVKIFDTQGNFSPSGNFSPIRERTSTTIASIQILVKKLKLKCFFKLDIGFHALVGTLL